MILDNVNYFIKKNRTPPTDYCQILSEVYTHMERSSKWNYTVTEFATI